MKLRKKICILIIIVAIIVAWSLFKTYANSMASVIPSFPKTAFTSLDELDFLSGYEVDEEVGSDAALGELEPKESKVIAVKYKNRVYNIYAYVFDSKEDAFRYYSNAGGLDQPLVARGLYLLETDQLVDTKYCAYYENCAYRITGTGFNKFCKFMEWFGAQLPIDIRQEFYNDFGQWLPG